MTKLKGADVSKWQGVIDFTLLQSAIQFIIIRSSYGVGYTDAQFVNNRNGAKSKGLLRGYYHYAYPQYNTPEAEAEWFLKVLGKIEDGEVLVLDIEETYADIVTWSKKFLDRVASLTNGCKPLIYLNQAQVKGNNWKLVIDAGYGLWLAQYDYNFDGTCVSTPWSVVAMRQYSNKEVFPGVSGGVDADVFYGDDVAFRKYGYKAPVVDTPPVLEVTNQTLIPQIVNDKGQSMEVQAIVGMIGDLRKQVDSKQQKNDELVVKQNQEILAIQKANVDATQLLINKNETLTTDNKTLIDSNKILTTQNETLTGQVKILGEQLAFAREEKGDWTVWDVVQAIFRDIVNGLKNYRIQK